MTAELSDEDRGKAVVAGTERIGVITEVRSGTAYVDPDFDHVPSQLGDALGWESDDDQYTLSEDAVTNVQNAEVRLREDIY